MKDTQNIDNHDFMSSTDEFETVDYEDTDLKSICTGDVSPEPPMITRKKSVPERPHTWGYTSSTPNEEQPIVYRPHSYLQFNPDDIKVDPSSPTYNDMLKVCGGLHATLPKSKRSKKFRKSYTPTSSSTSSDTDSASSPSPKPRSKSLSLADRVRNSMHRHRSLELLTQSFSKLNRRRDRSSSMSPHLPSRGLVRRNTVLVHQHGSPSIEDGRQVLRKTESVDAALHKQSSAHEPLRQASRSFLDSLGFVSNDSSFDLTSSIESISRPDDQHSLNNIEFGRVMTQKKSYFTIPSRAAVKHGRSLSFHGLKQKQVFAECTTESCHNLSTKGSPDETNSVPLKTQSFEKVASHQRLFHISDGFDSDDEWSKRIADTQSDSHEDLIIDSSQMNHSHIQSEITSSKLGYETSTVLDSNPKNLWDCSSELPRLTTPISYASTLFTRRQRSNTCPIAFPEQFCTASTGHPSRRCIKVETCV